MSNQVTVVGNLTREPELRYTPSGAAVAKFGLAVNRSYTNRNGEKVEDTSFFNVNAWRQLAENVAESLSTGIRVIVSGRLQSRSWETEARPEVGPAPAEEDLSFLQGADRLRRLQGSRHPAEVRLGSRQDPGEACDRYLHAPPARRRHGDQERPRGRTAAVRRPMRVVVR